MPEPRKPRMEDNHLPQDEAPGHADPDWFRPPSRREHRIAAWLFVGFGIFFAMLFWVERNFWFRWIILAMAIGSTWHGLRHAYDSRRSEV